MATLNSLEFTGSYNSFNGSLFSTQNTSSAGLLFYSGSDFYFTSQNAATWSLTSANKAQRRAYSGGVGDQSEFLEWGGEVPNIGFSNTSCIYNGSSWANGPNMTTTGRGYMGSFGTTNNAISAGGGLQPNGNIPTNATEEYNGSSWSSGGNMITGLKWLGAAGQSGDAGIVFGGKTYPSSNLCPCRCTETYDGTSWTTQGPLIVGAECTTGFGTQNDAVKVAGKAWGSCNSPYGGINQNWRVEGWDGIGWSTLANTDYTPGIQCVAMGLSSNEGQSMNRSKNTGYNGIAWYSKPTIPTTIQSGAMGNNAQMGAGIAPSSCCTLLESIDTNIVIKKLS